MDCLNSGSMLSSINLTHITLIPKKKNAESMSHFRPISLCNVIFKIVSKVLANRLKKILGTIISDCQSAFVSNKLITDNILISFETLHYMKTKRWGNTTHMALKLDMSKAYDRVEWDYLEALMFKMGFHPRWVNLVMVGISSVSYSVIMNGVASGYIKPSRGIRQGDPLSPHLFLLCSEGFTALIRNAAQTNRLHGIRISRNAPRITHLLFADDSLLFCNASMEECQVIKEILCTYELASGQKVNCDKTSIFFSKNTSLETRVAIRTFLNATSSEPFEKYLGLPPIIGRGKKQAFADIKLKVQSKLNGWKGKLLSQAGKEVLIKSVAQAIPGWRLLHCHESLFYKVFKSKYFPNESFLEASIPSHSSYAWRSIAQCRDLLLQGSRWRVGNGTLISIWWKTFFIDSIFFSFEAEIIKSIPLSIRQPSDSLIWTKNRAGTFTVRSAYFLQKEIEEAATRNGASSSSTSRFNSFWNSVWSSLIPPKIKCFIWRACKDSLPLRTKLFDRKISNSFSCVLCNDAAESCSHLLWECSFAQAVWLEAPFRNSFSFPLHTQFIDIIDAAIKKLQSPEFEILCVAFWMIWNCRNKVVFENSNPKPDGLWSRASIYTLEFMEVNKKHLVSSAARVCRWSPPSIDSVFKLNIAISQSKSSSFVGVGLLIRNSKGEVMAAACEQARKELNALWTAASVVRIALLFCQKISFTKITAESNFAELVDLLNSDRTCSLEVAWILEDIKLICEHFVDISFVSVPLKCNRAALALASVAKENEEAIVWIEECPSFLFPIVQLDIE
ncbi:uncharacterized protein LOC142624852 [Castanea sativa]|uniref:uncharacterized protein LOC142624852 n=1 Tax=Castanea sativa TaxID=21020 RepID=UPI003F6538C9